MHPEWHEDINKPAALGSLARLGRLRLSADQFSRSCSDRADAGLEPLRSEERPDVAVRADASTGVFANASSDSAVSAARPANDSGPRVVLRSADAKAAKTRSAIRCRVRQSRI